MRFRGLLYEAGLSPQRDEVLTVRLEVDTNPPAGAVLVRRHVTLRLQHHDRASLLAGKLHAILQRSYTKGRDIYDLIWYLSDRTWPAPNLFLLNAALQQTEWPGEALTVRTWREVLGCRLRVLAWDRVLADVRPFLEREEDAELLNVETALQLLGG